MNTDPTRPGSNLPDFDPKLENDALWSLLDEASSSEPSTCFATDTLRRCRLEEGSPKVPWWKSVLAPKSVAGVSLAALAAIVVVISLPDPPAPTPAQSSHTPENTATTEDWENLEDSLARELLSGAAEDPSLLSDEEIVALLF